MILIFFIISQIFSLIHFDFAINFSIKIRKIKYWMKIEEKSVIE